MHRAVRIRVATAGTPAQRSAGARTQDEIIKEAFKVSDANSRKTLAAAPSSILSTILHHHRIIIPSAQSVFVEISGLALQVPRTHYVIDLLLHPFRSPPSSRVKFPLGGTARPARFEHETKQEEKDAKMEVEEKDIRMAAMESLVPGDGGGPFPNKLSNVLRVRRYEERGRSARRYSPQRPQEH